VQINAREFSFTAKVGDDAERIAQVVGDESVLPSALTASPAG
jgi:hypothetical protein